MNWMDKLKPIGKEPEKKRPEAPQQASGDFAEAIKRVAEKAGLVVLIHNPTHVCCIMRLRDNRTQMVHLNYAGDMGKCRIANIWTPVKELPISGLPSDVAEGLLQENAKMKIGSFALSVGNDKKILVMQHNMILDTLDPEEFGIVVLTLATCGDQWEQKLGGEDKF